MELVKQKESRKNEDRNEYLNHKIQMTNDKISRYRHRLNILEEEEPFNKTNNQEELVHLSMDIKTLEERLEDLMKKKDYQNTEEKNRIRKFYRRFNDDDKN